jgi:hypothetical protein
MPGDANAERTWVDEVRGGLAQHIHCEARGCVSAPLQAQPLAPHVKSHDASNAARWRAFGV